MNTETMEYYSDEDIKKSFVKMKNRMEKEGYRDGVGEGRQKVFQKYFDEGYKNGFQIGYSLGRNIGTTISKPLFEKVDCQEEPTLEKSIIDSCVMCADGDFLTKSIDEIQANQNTIMNSVDVSNG